MRYAHAVERDAVEDLSFRVYVTDTLKLMGENKYPSQRWYDTLERKPVDNRTGDEIALAVIRAAGLSFKDGE